MRSGLILYAVIPVYLLVAALPFAALRLTEAAKSAVWWVLITYLVIFLASRCRPRGRRLMVWGWAAIFAVDFASQLVIRQFFGAKPQPLVLAQALANTDLSESMQFVVHYGREIVAATAYMAGFLALFYLAMRYTERDAGHKKSALRKPVFLTTLSFACLLHFNPTMLRDQPLTRWAVISMRYQKSVAEIDQAKEIRKSVWANRAAWVPKHDQSPRTVVLVIGESDNRMNWSLYGYSRPTNDSLRRVLTANPGAWRLIEDARSLEAFTFKSLQRTLVDTSEPSQVAWATKPDLFMLAQAAGFHVTWLSNQPKDHGWLAAMAETADQSIFINSGNWRDSSTVDLDLLPKLEHRLQSVHPRELIVLHILGQHFHYDLRCPKDMKPFLQANDAVAREMLAAGRSASIIASRNAFDNAVHCGSELLANTLQQVIKHRTGRKLSLLYFSDHGQEVGHYRDFSGHSSVDPSGFSIPILIWLSENQQHDWIRELPRDLSLDAIPVIFRKLTGIAPHDQ